MQSEIKLTALILMLSLGYSQAQVARQAPPAPKKVYIGQPVKPTGAAPSGISAPRKTASTANSSAAQNTPIIKTGVQTVYTVGQLLGNSAVKMISSTNYQVSIVFPAKVQSIGINANKQHAIMATIDEYDGRVVYLDALKVGGTATLNFRLLTEGDEYEEKTGKVPPPSAPGARSVNQNRDPLILKVLVDLTDKDHGVLSYTIRKTRTAPAPVAAARPPAPVPASAPVVKPRPIPAPVVRPTIFTGTTSGVTLTVRQAEAAKKPESQAYSYNVELSKPVEGKTYALDTARTTLRVRNIPVADLSISQGAFPITPSAPVTGTLEIPRRVQQQAGPKVLMFAIVEKDSATQTEKRKYVGVILK